MQVKRYEAVNIQEALAKVKSDMGPDAIVLSTKRLPGEKRLIEVLAAKDNGCAEQEIFTTRSPIKAFGDDVCVMLRALSS